MRTPIFALLFTVVSACAGEVVAPTVTPPTTLPPTSPPPTSPPPSISSTRTHQLTVDGIVRTYIVYAPSGVASTQRLPVVFMLHGTSGDGLKFLQISEWREKCEAVKCIAVFPSSLEYCIIDEGVQKRTTKWHTSDLDRVACSGQTLADDVKFFRAMNTAVATIYSVEPKKIYVSGFSNGAGMASLLWAAASDLLAGVASSAGFHSDSTIVSTSRVPLFFHDWRDG